MESSSCCRWLWLAFVALLVAWYETISAQLVEPQLLSPQLPPRQPPPELLAAFTLDGQAALEQFHVDDSDEGRGTHYRFDEKSMEVFVRGAQKTQGRLLDQLERQGLSLDSPQLAARFPSHQWLYLATLRHLKPVLATGQARVAVFGSMEPWVEAWFVQLGAAEVVTFEYNALTYAHPAIRTVSGDQFPTVFGAESPYFHHFDVAVSMSAFDHDGLGRYGDPIDPTGDLAAMRKVAHVLKPKTGVLLLSVPIGPDLIVWNTLRRYGPARLPLLLEGWEILDRFGWESPRLTAPAPWRKPHEPIFLLRPTTTTTTTTITSAPSHPDL